MDNTLVFTSACCILPPLDKVTQIEEIRKNHDKSYDRWPPHINLFFPFFREATFGTCASRFQQFLDSNPDVLNFDVSLNSFNYFKQSKSCTVFVSPNESSSERLCKLFQDLVVCFPECQNSDRNQRDFHPHLTVAQCTSENEAKRLCLEFANNFQPIVFNMRGCLSFIARLGEERFRIIHQFPSLVSISSPSMTSVNENTVSVYAIDDSGSTNSNVKYWSQVHKLVSLSKPEDKFLFWNDQTRFTTRSDLFKHSQTIRRGNGCTEPASILPFLVRLCKEQPRINRFIIVTDGQIMTRDVERTDRDILALNIQELFQYVECHIIHTSGSVPDLSVVAPFIRKSIFKITVDDRIVSTGNTRTTIDLKQYETDPSQFLTDFPSILTTITAQNLGQDNENLRNQLLSLQKEMLKSCSRQFSAESISTDETTDIIKMLQTKSDSVYKKVTDRLFMMADSYYAKNSTPLQIQNAIAELVRSCSVRGNYSTSSLDTNRAQRALQVQEPNITDASAFVPAETELESPTSNEPYCFSCPISMDQDYPVLMMVDTLEPLLETQTKDFVEEVTTNPLLALRNSAFLDSFAKLVDHPIGLEAIKTMTDRGDDLISAFTRKPLIGGFPLGNHFSHVDTGDKLFAHLLAKGKMLGNSNLWMVVLWHVVKTRVSYLSTNLEFMSFFEEHLKYRLTTGKMYLGMSGLPEFPLVLVPIVFAFLYCFESSFRFANQPKKDRLLAFFGPPSDAMLSVFKDVFKLFIPESAFRHRSNQIEVVSYWMRHKEDYDIIKKMLFAQVQPHLCFVDPSQKGYKRYSIVFIDNDPKFVEERIERIERDRTLGAFGVSCPIPLPSSLMQFFSAPELWSLFSLVDVSKKLSDLAIPIHIKDIDYRKKLDQFIAWPQFYDSKENAPVISWNFKVNPGSLRPPMEVNGIDWMKLAEQRFGPLPKQISLFARYLDFVAETNTVPSSSSPLDAETFIIWLHKKENNRAVPKKTLPTFVQESVPLMFSLFEEALNIRRSKHANWEPTATNINLVAQKSLDRDMRQIMETQ